MNTIYLCVIFSTKQSSIHFWTAHLYTLNSFFFAVGMIANMNFGQNKMIRRYCVEIFSKAPKLDFYKIQITKTEYYAVVQQQ